MTDDLCRRLLRYHGRDPFLREMRDYVRYGGQLSIKQQHRAEAPPRRAVPGVHG